ncbi:serine/threonine protein kinase [Haliangium sp.]|uniref:serine/threonine protein kinase n=1 Tax=Haliangium sp. TaxID=2663208 RepID=UPI003D10E38D
MSVDPNSSQTRRMYAGLNQATIPDRDPGPALEHDAGPADRAYPLPTMSSRLGRFVVLERLGEGGMGVVYTAYDDHLDRKVALKLLHPGSESTSRAAARLRREAKAMARLSHPNVVPVFDVGDYQGHLFVAMEFVAGQTLGDWQNPVSGPRRSWREILAVHIQAGRGLAAAHQAGLVHRDYKPSNVLVSDDGRARVLDFGLVRQDDSVDADPAPAPAQVPEHGTLGQDLTMDGAIVGTPAYMSPEQFTGEQVDTRSDQFSFCVALYEALYGVNPYVSPNMGARMMRIMHGDLSAPPEGCEVPAWLHQIIARGLSFDPTQRWPSMTALLDELALELGDDGAGGHERDPARALRHSRKPLLGGALAFAATAIGVWLVHDHLNVDLSQAATSPVGALVVSLLVSGVLVAVVGLGRRTLMTTRASRRLVAIAAVTCVGIVLTRVVPLAVPVRFELGFVYGQIIVACVAATAAATMMRALYWIAAVWLALVPLSLWHLEHASALQSLGVLLTCAMGAYRWYRS